MNSTLESFQYLKRFFTSDFITSLTEDSFLNRILVDKDPRADILRQNIDECLELAYRYNLVDADFEGRLKKGDWESWQATINELKVAKFLENIFGNGSLRWHPRGRKEKTGEFEITSRNLDKPIFVEVKSVFPRETERLEKRIREKISLFVEQVPLPFFLDIQIEELGDSENFSGVRFRKFLVGQLSKINVNNMKKENLKLPNYKDNNTGLFLEIQVLPITPSSEQEYCRVGVMSAGFRVVDNKEYLEHSLDKAYTQLPKSEQPSLVIICSSAWFPIDEDDMLNTLLGTLALRVYQFTGKPTTRPPSTKPEVIRKLDGFPRPQYNRHLSAIGLYKEKFIEYIEKKLEIYHNPWAINPLDCYIFKGQNVRQLVKDSDGQMKWID